jgi:hypothetical protein
MQTFNVYQPQNYQGSSLLNRGIKNILITVDDSTGSMTSEEVAPLFSDWPFVSATLNGNHLYTGNACEGFTGVQDFDITSGKILQSIIYDRVGKLKYSGDIYSYDTHIEDYRNNYGELQLAKIDSVTGNIIWNNTIAKGYNVFGADYYVNDNLQIILVGILNNGVSSIQAFNSINGASINVTNNGFNFTGKISVVYALKGDNSIGIIAAYQNNTINFATFTIAQNGITITAFPNISYPFTVAPDTVNPIALRYNSTLDAIILYTINANGNFAKVTTYLSTMQQPAAFTFNVNPSGNPYQIKINTVAVDHIEHDIVFVARTDQDNTTQDVAIIPDLSTPSVNYFGDNRQAVGIEIKNNNL